MMTRCTSLKFLNLFNGVKIIISFFMLKKTKELVNDFCKDNDVTVPLIISDETVERVENYKYLGTVINNKLAFDSNSVIIKKEMSI